MNNKITPEMLKAITPMGWVRIVALGFFMLLFAPVIGFYGAIFGK